MNDRMQKFVYFLFDRCGIPVAFAGMESDGLCGVIWACDDAQPPVYPQTALISCRQNSLLILLCKNPGGKPTQCNTEHRKSIIPSSSFMLVWVTNIRVSLRLPTETSSRQIYTFHVEPEDWVLLHFLNKVSCEWSAVCRLVLISLFVELREGAVISATTKIMNVNSSYAWEDCEVCGTVQQVTFPASAQGKFPTADVYAESMVVRALENESCLRNMRCICMPQSRLPVHGLNSKENFCTCCFTERAQLAFVCMCSGIFSLHSNYWNLRMYGLMHAS